MKIKLLLLLSPVLFSACAAAPPHVQSASYEPPVVVVQPHNVVDEMLAYHQQLLRMSRPELSQELDRQLEKPKALDVTLRKAMILGQLGRRNELARAQLNLAEVLNHPSVEAQQLKPLAQLLAAHYTAAQRAADQLEANERSLGEVQHRIQQLNQTLEQLKAVERSLPSRMGAAPLPPETQRTKK